MSSFPSESGYSLSVHPTCPPTDEWINMYDIYPICIHTIFTQTSYIQWSIMQPQRKVKLYQLQARDRTGGHQVWNKPNRRTSINVSFFSPVNTKQNKAAHPKAKRNDQDTEGKRRTVERGWKDVNRHHQLMMYCVLWKKITFNPPHPYNYYVVIRAIKGVLR